MVFSSCRIGRAVKWLITVCVRLVAQPQILINGTKAICAINFTLCYSQLYFIR
jgi:hypothetical protein